jgi:homoserine trans-succinylase
MYYHLVPNFIIIIQSVNQNEIDGMVRQGAPLNLVAVHAAQA